MLIQLLIQLCVSVAGLLDTQMQKVARVKAPKVVIHDDNYCIEDKMWVSQLVFVGGLGGCNV